MSNSGNTMPIFTWRKAQVTEAGPANVVPPASNKESEEVATAAFPEPMTALASDLPPAHDALLKKIIDKAMRQCRTRGTDTKKLFRAFLTGQYTKAEFDSALASLESTLPGSAPRVKVSAWLLGVASLKPEDRNAAAHSLRILLRDPPVYNPSGARGRMEAAISTPLGVAILIASVAVNVGSMLSWGSFYGNCLSVSFHVILLSLILIRMQALRRSEARESGEMRYIAAHALGRLGMVEAVGDLSSVSLEKTSKLPEMALISLRVLLPLITPEHYGQLGPELANNLCQILTRPSEIPNVSWKAEFIIKTIDAIGKVGDGRAIPFVQQAAGRWTYEPVLRASSRALAALEERQRTETERATLLRGAEQPVISNTELLRASIAQTESKPEQLLRPID